MNLRPSGYEPDELPCCSTPRHVRRAFYAGLQGLSNAIVTFFRMQNKIDKISLIIPVYNEEENLRDLYREITRSLSGLACGWEMVLVDDGSSDGSLSIIRELASADPLVRYIAFARN